MGTATMSVGIYSWSFDLDTSDIIPDSTGVTPDFSGVVPDSTGVDDSISSECFRLALHQMQQIRL